MSHFLFVILKRFPTKPVKSRPEANPWTAEDVLIVAVTIIFLAIVWWIWKKRKS